MYIRRAADVGALIRDRRKAAGLTQGALAAKLGTSQRWISELERGKPTAELEMVPRTVNALELLLSVHATPSASSDVVDQPKGKGKSASSRPRINVNDLVDD